MFPSDKGLTLETSASEILTEANLLYQLINKTKLPQGKSLSDIMEHMWAPLEAFLPQNSI